MKLVMQSAAWLLATSLPNVLGLVSGPWSDKSLSPEHRARALVEKMTLDEKLVYLHGPSSGPCCECNSSVLCAYTGNVPANARLGIPPITMNDGPQGFRDNLFPGTTTAWPSSLTMAATFDRDAVREWGEGMGREFKGKGANVQLGPGFCLARVPRNGRNFEYLSGEDPFLGAQLAGPAVHGIQSQNVVANAKHWVLNNQETSRDHVSAEADERTRFEMYYPPFAAASDAGVGSMMCGYNKIKGIWSCENPETLARDLKQYIGFKGYVMSDWGATHSTSIMKGLDMEMPGADWMNPTLIVPALAAGTVSLEAIDDSVRRILGAMFSVGVMDQPASTWDWANHKNNVTSEASVALAQRLSAASTVLLKNEKELLPLKQGQKIAVIGLADKATVTHGGGSGYVTPSFLQTPLAGIMAVAGEDHVVFNDGKDIQSAAALAATADVAIVFVATVSSEGGDRASLSLDDGSDRHNQTALVMKVAAANPNTVVVVSTPGAILMPWSNEVAAILTNFMPGQAVGGAITSVLFGTVNPTARLPVTFPNIEDETAMTPAQWPGLPDPNKPDYAFYTEKLLVGYRYYDAMGIQFTTGFPFGHGLSYTAFEYSALTVDQMTVTFTVLNSGKLAGAEVAQVYLSFPTSAGEPLWQLKGFHKTSVLQPGQVETVRIDLLPRDVSIWDINEHAFTPVTGLFHVRVGASSRDIRLQGDLNVQEVELVV